MTETATPPASPLDQPLPLGLRATRGGLRALSSVAPCIAARAAERLFCSPRRFRRPDREVAALDGAERFTVRMGLESVAAWRWGRGPVILLAHGWEGRGSQLHAFVEPLVEAGFAVVTWDAPGHGESSGRTSSLVEFADALFAVYRHVRASASELGLGEVRALIAHSMGCAATALAIDEGLELRRIAFVSPPADLERYAELFGDLLGLKPGIRRRMIRSMERRYQIQLEELSFERRTHPEGLPLLVVHDRDDVEVPWEAGAEVAKLYPGASLVVTEGLGHRRLLRDPEVVELVSGWVRELAQPNRTL